MSAPQRPFSGVEDEPQKLANSEHPSVHEQSEPEQYLYTKEWRHTRMGGRTKNVAVCSRCGYITPYAVRSSRMGTHGQEYYRHQHPLVFLVLYQSNTGRREYVIQGEPEPSLADRLRKLGEAWSVGIANIADIIDYLEEG